MLTAILVEDYEITRLGLRVALKKVPGIELIAECASGEESIELVSELSPNIVFMDIGLPGISGLAATEIIKNSYPDVKVMLLTSHDGEEDVAAGLRAGANAYCLKDISIASLSNAINSVMDGAIWVDPLISKTLVSLIRQQPVSTPNPALLKQTIVNTIEKGPHRLSEREMEVLSHLVSGMSNKQMAEQMFVSQETIKTHLRHVFEKLDAADRTQAAIKALKLGLVN